MSSYWWQGIDGDVEGSGFGGWRFPWEIGSARCCATLLGLGDSRRGRPGEIPDEIEGRDRPDRDPSTAVLLRLRETKSSLDDIFLMTFF
jgi:hypothetical protein